ncbi:uncharacterized protein [Cicer arietinum]|uniref:Uncharacterized protein LOC101498936 n=1 Tax=Cicer arietinum TaxID=3827 RepID=A0A1S2XZW5_CICAR|nr:uncharacterized protein LOC101498936 [Cicer arietinum]
MKRQRGVNGVNNTNNPHPNVEEVATLGKKKGKKESEQRVVVEEKRKENKDMSDGKTTTTTTIKDGVSINNVMGWNLEDYMPWLGGVVDEQMSWGSNWFPDWDMDYMGEAFNDLYSDVVWDDDIWNLNKEIPIPLHGMRFEWE